MVGTARAVPNAATGGRCQVSGAAPPSSNGTNLLINLSCRPHIPPLHPTCTPHTQYPTQPHGPPHTFSHTPPAPPPQATCEFCKETYQFQEQEILSMIADNKAA